MATSAFEWVTRVVMLVLAGLVTLSILGSIAAMSNDPGPGGFTVAADRPLVEAAPATNEQAARTDPEAQGQQGAGPSIGAPGTTGAIATASASEEKAERWLEAIAYALLALAGLGAIGLVMLWGVLRELRRIGDGLVSRPPRP